MGKTRDLFKKIRDTRGTFHAKMGSIKDRNGMDLPGSSAQGIYQARVLEGGSRHCIGGSDQDHPQEKEMQKGRMVV